MHSRTRRIVITTATFALLLSLAAPGLAQKLELKKGDHISYVGNNLADRMQHDGWLETLIQARFPNHDLSFRNLGFTGDEIDKRPRSNNFGTPDHWLTRCKTDVVFAFFGYNESFAGEGGVDAFKKKLAAWVDHTLQQKYNGKSNARVVLFTPITHEDLKSPHLPDGKENNARLSLYAKAIIDVAKEKGVPAIDLFTASQKLYDANFRPMTMNGIHLTTEGNRQVAHVIDTYLFGLTPKHNRDHLKRLRAAILDKNFHWFNLYRTVDGYNVYGGRSKLNWHGQSNADVMQREMDVFEVMTANRQKRVWAVARGSDLKVDDSNTPPLLKVKTNRPGPLEGGKYPFLGGEEAIGKMKVAKGMKVNLFASEEMFPDLINPVQMSVDPDGRLWVATWPTYPHWNPKEELKDKLVILPDEDGDGKADKMIVFAEGLNSITGFAFWGGGVLVAAAPEIWFLKDTDGDDKADVKIRMFQGVSSADTHHTANALVVAPDGGLYWSRGVFHVTNAETPTKTFRSTRSGVYRFDPRTFEIDFHFPIGPNPHGHVIDQWGYQFATDGTSGTGSHMAIGKGVGAPQQWYRKRVRPVPATGILSSSHFPPENNGNFLICNAIGFLGVLQHEVKYDGATITAHEIEPIVVSSDPNFRPTDLEVAGDGALYISDWCNPLIGHMQHNMRDPNRDALHGRIYRVTYEGRPLLKPVKLIGKPLQDVFRAFYAKENGTRYRARLELSGRKTTDVVAALSAWTSSIQPDSPENEQALLESLWVFQEHRVPNEALLRKVLKAKEPRVRAAAIRTLGHWGPNGIENWAELLIAAARDAEPLVRAEAVIAAPSFEGVAAAEAIFEAATRPTDVQLDFNLNWARGQLNIDAIVRNAVESGKPLSKAAQAYALQKASISSLLKMEMNEAVAEALLTRTGVKPNDRLTALEYLSNSHKQSVAVVLIAAMHNNDGKFTATLPDLAKLLPGRPTAELKSAVNDLGLLAVQGKNPAVKEAAYAAMIIAEGGPITARHLANQSMGNMQTFLRSLRLINSKSVHASVYPDVKRLTHTLPPNLKADADANPGTVGRFVRIELPRRGTLTLAEVEVMSGGVNVAKGKKASQLNVASGGTANRAVDGDTTGVYGQGSATHTQENTPNPWWEVDLGASVPIESIKVWNRTDCCTDRLQGFTITVLDGSRAKVWSKADNKLKTHNIAFTLDGDPAAAVHLAAIDLLPHVAGNDGEAFAQLVDLIAQGKYRAQSIAAILRTSRKSWTGVKAVPLAAALRNYVPSFPLNQRTSQAFKNSQKLAQEIALILPKGQGAKLLEELADLNLQVIRIETVPTRMIYNKTRFAVVAGKPLRIVLDNKDHMPHNLLVVQPGGSEVVGPLAEKMGQEGFKKGFVPDSSLILHTIKMVNPDESKSVEFVAPTKPGKYEYVCTFPGHWRLMRGEMLVVPTAADLPPDAAGAAPRVVKNWTVDDLADDLHHVRHGRSFKAGLDVFTKLGCAQCHKIKGEGGVLGPDLTETFKKWKGDRKAILTQLIKPSDVVEEKFRAVMLENLDGDRIFGLVANKTKDYVEIVTGATTPPIRIKTADIDTQRVTKQSIMPTGLLNTLTRQEVLDLMAYIEAGGDAGHAVYKKH